MDVGQIAAGLASSPLAWLSTLLLAAVVYLFREIRAADKEAMTRTIAQEAAHRATLEKVLPIAEKLTSAVEVLERISIRDGH